MSLSFKKTIKLSNITALLICTISLGVFAKEGPEQSKNHKHQRPSFSSIDSNADTDISLDEFSALELPFGDAETVFLDIDTDNNGVISEAEFNAHKPPHRKHNSRK